MPDCSVLLRGTAADDRSYFGFAEINGNPYVFKTSDPDKNLFLLGMNNKICFFDIIDRFDIYGWFPKNDELRTFLEALEDETLLFGEFSMKQRINLLLTQNQATPALSLNIMTWAITVYAVLFILIVASFFGSFS